MLFTILQLDGLPNACFTAMFMQHMLVSSGKQRKMRMNVMCPKMLMSCPHNSMEPWLLQVLYCSELCQMYFCESVNLVACERGSSSNFVVRTLLEGNIVAEYQ